MTAGLVQLLTALVGAALISAAIMGFRAEWHALFKKPFGARLIFYSLRGLSSCDSLVRWHWLRNGPPNIVPRASLLGASSA